jgi:hypothetical protein
MNSRGDGERKSAPASIKMVVAHWIRQRRPRSGAIQEGAEVPDAVEETAGLEERLLLEAQSKVAEAQSKVLEARSKMVDVSQLTAGILSGLLLLLLQALPNPLPDPRSFVADWSWLQWIIAGVSLVTVAAAIRIAMVMLVYHDELPPWLIRGSAAVLVVLIALTSLPHWLGPDETACGAAEIAVDDLMLSQLQIALGKYQHEAADRGKGIDGRSVKCAGSLQMVGIGLDQDLRERLGTSASPLAAVVTSNPAIIRGLQGDWHNLEVGSVATPKWYTIGLDAAMVYLSGSARTRYAQITLSQLPKLYARAGKPADPVALEVFSALGGKPTPRLDVRPEDIEATKQCPAAVILPASWTPSCSTAGVKRVSIVDGEGNFIGVPVMAIPLQVERANPALARTGPTDSAHRATVDFLAWLEGDHAQLGLKNLLDPAPAILARAKSVLAIPSRREADVTVVVDASLSMGRVSDAEDFGGTPAWRPAVAGVNKWADSNPLRTGDQLTVVVAQLGRAGLRPQTVRLPASAAAGLQIPTAAPGGGSGLSVVLQQIRQAQGQPAQVGRTHLTVLLTDAVNVFKEKPVADLRGVEVVVIGNSKGCLPVPAAARKRCLTSAPAAADIAAELTTLTGDS